MKKNNVRLFALALAFSGSVSAFAQTPEQRAEIVKHYDQKKNQELYERLKRQEDESYKKALQLAEEKGWPLEIEKENGIKSLLVGVTKNNDPVYIMPYNEGAAVTARVTPVRSGGPLLLDLNGQDMVIGIWEPGNVRKNHIDLTGRVTVMDGANFTSHDSNNGHATHVSGTMIGSGLGDADAKGLAYQATLLAHNSFNDVSEASARASNGLLVSNHSYGLDFDVQPEWVKGAYTDFAAAWDQVTYNHEYYLPVFAAGNDRVANEKDILVGDVVSKNTVGVAATLQVNNYIGPSSVQITSFSSYGPTDDHRVKPDIATKGQGVFSCYSESNTSYATLQGTSMAAPGVTASLALMQQHHGNLHEGSFMRAATLKALMIHTADEAGTSDGPDYRFGWGLINTAAAVGLLTADKNQTTAIVEENTLTQSGTYQKTVKAGPGGEIKVTISWTDRPGNVNNGVEDLETPVLVNDLDVRVSDGTNTYLPWRLNTITSIAEKGDNYVDNVEVIEIDNADPGASYTVTVSHKGNLQSFAPQKYSLIISGITDINSVSNSEFSKFGVYPNPANDVLNITLDGSLEGQSTKTVLYDVQGRFVKNFGGSKNNLDVSGVAPGIYLLTVDVNNGAYTESKKIVIK
ncbi:hypothetical protein GCM10007424_15120 [Flavobacterium suaedae]|uniref:T9SS type A sorting domain-containing protein n=1 Tax=Flavobacterium suaedae TaxID=1767027 RepID=A0ABQ1JT35_9FLAO|nr:S8 family serine peptidase [Flavobacterium suaedae]GGB76105.1 hypothetical protein GCM10007424_15120 [Flavobacterium suaedae]